MHLWLQMQLHYQFLYPWTHKLLIVYCLNLNNLPFFFLCLTANQDKTSRKHLNSTASSNPEPRKESLPLATAVNESSLLLEVRNHVFAVWMNVYLWNISACVNLLLFMFTWGKYCVCGNIVQICFIISIFAMLLLNHCLLVGFLCFLHVLGDKMLASFHTHQSGDRIRLSHWVWTGKGGGGFSFFVCVCALRPLSWPPLQSHGVAWHKG